MNWWAVVGVLVWIGIGGLALYSLRWDNPRITMALGLLFVVWAISLINSML